MRRRLVSAGVNIKEPHAKVKGQNIPYTTNSRNEIRLCLCAVHMGWGRRMAGSGNREVCRSQVRQGLVVGGV